MPGMAARATRGAHCVRLMTIGRRINARNATRISKEESPLVTPQTRRGHLSVTPQK